MFAAGRFVLVTLGIAACSPGAVKLELDPFKGASALLFVEGHDKAMYGIDLTGEPHVDARQIDDNDRLRWVVLYYPQTLNELGVSEGKITLVGDGVPYEPVPEPSAAAETTVDIGVDIALWTTLPAAPEDVAQLRLGVECPAIDDAPLPAEPIRRPAFCPIGGPPRHPVCWGPRRAWPNLITPGGQASESPAIANVEPDGTRWLYLSSNAIGQQSRLYRVAMKTATVTDHGRVEPISIQGPVPPLDGVRGGTIRADGLEVFFMSAQNGAFWAETLWVAARRSLSAPFGPPQRLKSLEIKEAQPHMPGEPFPTHDGELHFPVLLPDGRTLIYQEVGRPGLAIAERPTTTPGDVRFTSVGHLRPDDTVGDYQTIFLSCDRHHLIFVRRDVDAQDPNVIHTSARIVEIVHMRPLLLGRAELYPTPNVDLDNLFNGNITLAESPECDVLYLGMELGASIATAVPCP